MRLKIINWLIYWRRRPSNVNIITYIVKTTKTSNTVLQDIQYCKYQYN